MAQPIGGSGTVVLDTSTRGGTALSERKGQDSLFGPNIGVVSAGPAWTNVDEKKVLADELTQDIVQGWIARSKEGTQPTTTLQALVNLKRPTLRLSPLHSPDESNPEAQSSADNIDHHHGLEFEYDCDAPKCGIYVYVLLPAEHPDAPAAVSSNGLAKLLIFESVVDGGFGKKLTLEEGAMLELGRFERVPVSAESSSAAPPSKPSELPGADSSSENVNNSSRNRRRFSHFHFRKRPQNHSVSGPALAVVDVDPSAHAHSDSEKKDADNDGVKVTIRLAALDEQGAELESVNEQVTYLHVVKYGNPPESPEDADIRPWVVRVVKREATIGPHTFHLHEIYGLSSSSSVSNHAPTAPLPSNHTYPPNSPTTQTPVTEDEPSSECLVCLSSPREVVLLPCRHLVACKDCALNMVEFGAGGTITHPADEITAAGEEGAVETAEGETPATPVAPVPVPTRRKRKVKGWFCPVCRQPYTSLLRITTTPPPPRNEASDSPVASPIILSESAANVPSRPGILGFTRPSFMRNFNRPTRDADLEAQTARVGA